MATLWTLTEAFYPKHLISCSLPPTTAVDTAAIQISLQSLPVELGELASGHPYTASSIDEMSSPQQHAPERSIFGVDPLDDFVTMVADWIYANGRGRQNLEVSRQLSADEQLRSSD